MGASRLPATVHSVLSARYAARPVAPRCPLFQQYLLRALSQGLALSGLAQQQQKGDPKILRGAADHGPAALEAGENVAKVFRVRPGQDRPGEERRFQNVVAAARHQRAAHEGNVRVAIDGGQFAECVQQQHGTAQVPAPPHREQSAGQSGSAAR